MIVVDSCGWIAWLVGGGRAEAYAPLLRMPDTHVVVPTIVLFEVTRWVDRQHGAQRAREVAALLRSRTVVPLHDHVALLAVELSRRHQLATADALVYAHAQALHINLATSDAAFSGLPAIHFVAPSA